MIGAAVKFKVRAEKTGYTIVSSDLADFLLEVVITNFTDLEKCQNLT
jgi:hypothetical protein